jgi:predicted O-methyltransferase YrrM
LKYSNITEQIETINGFLAPMEGEELFNLAKASKGIIVELGSWEGKSTCCLAKGSQAGNNNKVYAIDIFTGSACQQVEGQIINTYEQFERNLKKLKVNDIVTPIISSSANACPCFDLPIHLLFVDAEHEYDDIKRDIDLWSPKVVVGGIIAMHDIQLGFPGCMKVFINLVNDPNYELVNIVHTLGVVRKIS